MDQQPESFAAVLRYPGAFVPLAMLAAALAVVLAHIAAYGIVHQADERAAAHLWQLLMAGQAPILAFFAFRWLPRAPRQALEIFALQAVAALAAMAPVYLFKM